MSSLRKLSELRKTASRRKAEAAVQGELDVSALEDGLDWNGFRRAVSSAAAGTPQSAVSALYKEYVASGRSKTKSKPAAPPEQAQKSAPKASKKRSPRAQGVQHALDASRFGATQLLLALSRLDERVDAAKIATVLAAPRGTTLRGDAETVDEAERRLAQAGETEALVRVAGRMVFLDDQAARVAAFAADAARKSAAATSAGGDEIALSKVGRHVVFTRGDASVRMTELITLVDTRERSVLLMVVDGWLADAAELRPSERPSSPRRKSKSPRTAKKSPEKLAAHPPLLDVLAAVPDVDGVAALFELSGIGVEAEKLPGVVLVAPKAEAFERVLSRAALEKLLSKEKLYYGQGSNIKAAAYSRDPVVRAVLARHVLRGAEFSGALKSKASAPVPTLAGERVQVNAAAGPSAVVLDVPGSVTAVRVDALRPLYAQNGVVYVADDVLITAAEIAHVQQLVLGGKSQPPTLRPSTSELLGPQRVPSRHAKQPLSAAAKRQLAKYVQQPLSAAAKRQVAQYLSEKQPAKTSETRERPKKSYVARTYELVDETRMILYEPYAVVPKGQTKPKLLRLTPAEATRVLAAVKKPWSSEYARYNLQFTVQDVAVNNDTHQVAFVLERNTFRPPGTYNSITASPSVVIDQLEAWLATYRGAGDDGRTILVGLKKAELA